MQYRVNNWLCEKDSPRETLFINASGDGFFSVPKSSIVKVDAISYTIETAHIKGLRVMDSSVYNLSDTARQAYAEKDRGYADADEMFSALAAMDVATAYGTKSNFERDARSKTDMIQIPASCAIRGEAVLENGSDCETYMVTIPGMENVNGFEVEKNDIKSSGRYDSVNLAMPREGTLLLNVYDGDDVRVVNMPVPEARERFATELALRRGWEPPKKSDWEEPEK